MSWFLRVPGRAGQRRRAWPNLRVCVACSVSRTPVTSSGVSASKAILLSVGMTASNASFSASEKSPAVTVSRTWASRPCAFGMIRAADSELPSEDWSSTCRPVPSSRESRRPSCRRSPGLSRHRSPLERRARTRRHTNQAIPKGTRRSSPGRRARLRCSCTRSPAAVESSYEQPAGSYPYYGSRISCCELGGAT